MIQLKTLEFLFVSEGKADVIEAVQQTEFAEGINVKMGAPVFHL